MRDELDKAKAERTEAERSQRPRDNAQDRTERGERDEAADEADGRERVEREGIHRGTKQQTKGKNGKGSAPGNKQVRGDGQY